MFKNIYKDKKVLQNAAKLTTIGIPILIDNKYDFDTNIKRIVNNKDKKHVK